VVKKGGCPKKRLPSAWENRRKRLQIQKGETKKGLKVRPHRPRGGPGKKSIARKHKGNKNTPTKRGRKRNSRNLLQKEDKAECRKIRRMKKTNKVPRELRALKYLNIIRYKNITK